MTRLYLRRAVFWPHAAGDGSSALEEEAGQFWLRAAFGNVMILVLRLVAVRNVGGREQNDKLMKINFLNRLRIINETASSKDKMQMLMPDFIVDRISNFEIASSRG